MMDKAHQDPTPYLSATLFLSLQCENVGGLLHPLFFKEQLDLLLTQTLDIEGPTRDEQHQMLDLLSKV